MLIFIVIYSIKLPILNSSVRFAEICRNGTIIYSSIGDIAVGVQGNSIFYVIMFKGGPKPPSLSYM